MHKLKKRNSITFCAHYPFKAVVELLCDEGAFVDAREEDKWTPLHLAVQYGQRQVVQALLPKFANWYQEYLNKYNEEYY
ncbi:unnamed protein product, partial [Notodromas monacha]